MTSVRNSTTKLLNAAARFIQFRSELAILFVLTAAFAVGTALRELLPVAGPSATFAAPDDRTSRRPHAKPVDSRRASPPPRPSQLVDVR
jgi:hypothetical protein